MLVLLGGLGLFMYGMRCMGEAIQKLSGPWIRRVFGRMMGSAPRRLLAGTAVSAIMQSSNTIVIAIVSFVNAGLSTLYQSISLIMGINVGATVTAWIIAILGLQSGLDLGAVIISGVGFVMTLCTNEKIRSLGNALLGLSLFLLAVIIMYVAFNDMMMETDLSSTIKEAGSYGILSTFGFFALGILMTFILRSSGSTLALTMIMCVGGWVSFVSGAAIVLGANLGATINGNIVARNTSLNARRTAFSHTLVNLIGVMWALPLLVPLCKLTDQVVMIPGWLSPMKYPLNTPIALAFFHTTFNLINILVLMWFTTWITRLVKFLVRKSKKSNASSPFCMLNSGIMSAGEVNIIQAHVYVVEYGHNITRMFDNVTQLFKEYNADTFNEIFSRIEKQEQQSDIRREELYDFLSNATKDNLGLDAKNKIEILFRLVSQIEILSDLHYSIAVVLKARKERNIWFDAEMREGINTMFSFARMDLGIMNANLSSALDRNVHVADLMNVKSRSVEYRNMLREKCLYAEHADEVLKRAQLIFSELLTRLEQMEDIMDDISENAAKLKGHKHGK